MATPAVTEDAAHAVGQTTTSTAASTTTGPAMASGGASERPNIAIADLDPHELDAMLSDLDEVLCDLDSSLDQEEGELFND